MLKLLGKCVLIVAFLAGAQRLFGLSTQNGEWLAYLLRQSAKKFAHAWKGALHPRDGYIHGGCQIIELVIAAGNRKTLAEIQRGDLPGCGRKLLQRLQRVCGYNPGIQSMRQDD